MSSSAAAGRGGSLLEERGLQMRRALEKTEAQQVVEGLIAVSRTAETAEAGETVVAELTYDATGDAWAVNPDYEHRPDAGLGNSPQWLESMLLGAIDSPRSTSSKIDRGSLDCNSVSASLDGNCDVGTILRELVSKDRALQMLVDENRSLRVFTEKLKSTIIDLGGVLPDEWALPDGDADAAESPVASPGDTARDEKVITHEKVIMAPGAKDRGLFQNPRQEVATTCSRCSRPLGKQMVRSRSWSAAEQAWPRTGPVSPKPESSATFRDEMEVAFQNFKQKKNPSSPTTSAKQENRITSSRPAGGGGGGGHTLFNQHAASFFDSIVSGLTLGVSTPSKRSNEGPSPETRLKEKVKGLEYTNDQLLLFVLDARARYPDLYLPDLG